MVYITNMRKANIAYIVSIQQSMCHWSKNVERVRPFFTAMSEANRFRNSRIAW